MSMSEIQSKIVLKKGKDEAVRRFHPWIFSGAIAKMSVNGKDGQIPVIWWRF
jgi:23S rRNA (cytosine1962-C5)-methyltransferase